MGGDYHVWYVIYDNYLYHNFLFQEAPKSIMAFYKSEGINVVDDENTYFYDVRAYKVPSQKKSEYIKLLNEHYMFEIIIIDCFSDGQALPEKKSGVGMARKIGYDYCIPYAKKSSLFLSLDADTLIHENYLLKIAEEYKTKI